MRLVRMLFCCALLSVFGAFLLFILAENWCATQVTMLA
jgi:hypothetical protein